MMAQPGSSRGLVNGDATRRDSIIVNPGFEEIPGDHHGAEDIPASVAARRRSDALQAPDVRTSPKRQIHADHIRDSMRSRELREPESVIIGTNPYIQPRTLPPNQVPSADYDDEDDEIEFTRKIMAKLPSRQHSAKDTVHRSISRSRRRQSVYPKRFIQRTDLTDSVADDLAQAAEQDQHVTTTEQIREMGTSLTRKKTLKGRLDTIEKKKYKRIGCFKRWQYSVIMWNRKQRYKFVKGLKDLELWVRDLKKIESRFGTGVTSYFRFLRWLFVLNLPTFGILLAFLVVPQSVYRFNVQSPTGYLPYNDFNFYTELLTGAGWLNGTEMYYGYYYNGTINAVSSLSYNMQYAYILAIGSYFLIWLAILAYSIANSYRKNYIEASDEFNFYYVSKIFVGWDHAIANWEAARLKHQSMYNEFREYLSVFHKPKRTIHVKDMCGLVALRIATNVVVLFVISGATYLIWYISNTQSLQTNLQVLRELAMPLCVCAVNYFLPIAFSIIGTFEQYQKPRTELYIAMIRTVLLKGAVLGVLIYIWYNLVTCEGDGDVIRTQQTKDAKCYDCWENFMGQELYRLMLVDFMITLIITFFDEFLRRVMSTYCCKKMPHPEFDIARNTLNLIYSQTLCWLGQYYSPLLTILQLIKLIVIFQVKSCSVRQNCVPSQKPWRGARANTIFLGFLFAAFLMAAISVAANVIFIKPSQACGPYRGLDTSYESILLLISDWKIRFSWLGNIISFVSSTGFIAFVIVFLIIGAHYLRMLAVARKESVKMIKVQLKLEGKDKVFLLKLYKNAMRQVGFRGDQSHPITSSRNNLPNSDVIGRMTNANICQNSDERA
ncbi:transmembrane channel-like protein 7 isoform X2 [Tubulanus polymorphus]|uniref:transmembrane channel-like protein 7 isoform X2 n=1 Tax=Tubulanus polymorphus TaxID=672921 RepID=UPI003DA37848